MGPDGGCQAIQWYCRATKKFSSPWLQECLQDLDVGAISVARDDEIKWLAMELGDVVQGSIMIDLDDLETILGIYLRRIEPGHSICMSDENTGDFETVGTVERAKTRG